MAECLHKHEGTKYEIKSGGFARYFDLIYYNKGKKDEKFMYGRELRDVINEEIRLCGYFVIITSEKMTVAQALELYKSRDASEKLMQKRDELRSKELMEAFARSERSFEEVMRFLSGNEVHDE